MREEQDQAYLQAEEADLAAASSAQQAEAEAAAADVAAAQWVVERRATLSMRRARWAEIGEEPASGGGASTARILVRTPPEWGQMVVCGALTVP
eukprot:SAG31_NODE_1188_length_9481_cov_14.760819_1_plen_94_part_00